MSQIFSPAKQLKLKPHFEINKAFFKAGISPERVPMDYLPSIIQEVNRNLLSALMECVNPAHSYYICFDELDLGFSKSDANYNLRLIGLLLASRKINLAARDANRRLSVLVFLRDDIYETLQYEDKNKHTETAVVRIEWDTPRTEHTLKKLMERRFGKLLGIPTEKSWDRVFDEQKQMTGRQKKYEHILDRTFLRPRDIIKFCNEILIAHKTRSDTPIPEQFDNKDVISARREFSDYFLRELDDEVFKHIPDYKNYLEVVKSLDSLQFEFSDFEKALNQRAQLFPAGKSASDILGELFEFSIVGYYKPGGTGFGGAEYVWKYKEPRARFNENAASYRIHTGLMEVLGLKKFTRSG